MSTLRARLLPAIAEAHSGDRTEGERIADAAVSAFRAWLEERHGCNVDDALQHLFMESLDR